MQSVRAVRVQVCVRVARLDVFEHCICMQYTCMCMCMQWCTCLAVGVGEPLQHRGRQLAVAHPPQRAAHLVRVRVRVRVSGQGQG